MLKYSIRCMLLDIYKNEIRRTLTVDKYVNLINSGIKPSEVLVLVQNSNARNQFAELVLDKLSVDAVENLNIHSFFSLVFNTISDNWCFVENSIKSGKSFIIPNLVGLEVSQFLLKDILKQIEVKGYNSKKSLLHQIFRRYSLIVQNNLSEDEVREKSKILGESFGEDAELIIKKLLSTTLKSRSLDYLRQTLIFKFIYINTDYFKNIKYLIVDDADEITPACFEFIKNLKPQLAEWLICFDSHGSSRCGYLSADASIENKLKNLFQEEVKKDGEFEQGKIIFDNILNNNHGGLKNFNIISLSKRADIIDFTISKIEELFKNNIKPNQISIVTPLQDEMLKFSLKEKLKTCNPLFISGSEKLIDNPLVKSSLNILKLMCGLEISNIELRVILYEYAGIPLKYCQKILEEYEKTKKLPYVEIEKYNSQYQNFLAAFEEVKVQNIKLSSKVFEIFTRVVTFAKEEQINKFNFFIKQLRDFESVFGEEVIKERIQDIVVQIENSIIAENPSAILKISDNDLIIATPQKIIDNKIETDYQIWLDVSNSEWIKTDTGPLYNAWVMQADWVKDEYTIEDDIFLSKQKTARILRKLLLLSKKYTWALSSLFDTQGSENLGGIEEYLVSEKSASCENKKFKIIPREDQKPVLDYKNGSMAISAVPGAGKTTVLLALIMKIIESGVKPDNIFVLTYMESAARNFRERIKNMLPDFAVLPNISTIHGLALKIIKDNSNFERLGLNSDFDICDDTQRIRILKSIDGKFTKKDIEEFDRAISVLKLQEGKIENAGNDKKVEKFRLFYSEYQKKLDEESLIDYDDILLMSVKLLENNPDIASHYQDICEYIIEDEAQDSSGIQQRLINILGKKHKNIIRCGDINQAITTTFTNADVEGFRNFIKNSEKSVEMNCSQRCAQDIMNLANKTVIWGKKLLPKSFYKILMHGVEGKNPISENAVISKIFEKNFEEKNYILKETKNIMTFDSNATIGILLRNNYQVSNWTTFINDAGFKTITRSESLGQKSIFNTIFAILKYIQNPYDNEIVASAYEVLSQSGFYKLRLQSDIRKSKKPFITYSVDDLDSEYLAQFLWDMEYWLNSSTLPMEELVIKIGLYYYSSDIEKSNVYLIATLIKRLNNSSNGNYDLTISRLEELAKKPSLSGFKFFSEEDDESAVKGKVQIMTMHKSKGDEFDYVFIPELTEKALPMDVSKVDLKGSTGFMEEIRGLSPNYKMKSEKDLKEFSAEENMRLFYVAITRAKKKLFITTSVKSKTFYGVEKEEAPNVIFEEVLSSS